jgi:Tol biopolymer transport system component
VTRRFTRAFAASILVLASACIRAGFDATLSQDAGPARLDQALGATDSAQAHDAARRDDALDPGRADALPLAGSCRAWGPFGDPFRVSAVNSADDDWAPDFGDSDRMLLLSSYRPGGVGSSDIWQAVRSTRDDLFGAPEPLVNLNSSSWDSMAVLSADGKTVVFTSDRGVDGTPQLWTARRSDRSGPFDSPRRIDEVVEESSLSRSVHLADDALTVWFCSNRNGGDWEFFVTTRDAVDASFTAPRLVPSLNSPQNEHSLTISGDGLEAIFSSERGGGQGALDLWIARRNALDEPFGDPLNLELLNTARDDTFPALSADGTTLYYNRDSDLAGTPPKSDIWASRRTCLAR